MSSNHLSEKKVQKYQTAQRRSDREGVSIGKVMKRRDTMGESNIKRGYG